MGQYWVVVNLDRREFLDPHQLGSGLKLREQAFPYGLVPMALYLLLPCSNGRGGGDFAPDPLIGWWTGHRIAIVGDYAENGDLPDEDEDASLIYRLCRYGQGNLLPEEHRLPWHTPRELAYTDITPQVIPLVERELECHLYGTGWRHVQWLGWIRRADGDPNRCVAIVEAVATCVDCGLPFAWNSRMNKICDGCVVKRVDAGVAIDDSVSFGNPR